MMWQGGFVSKTVNVTADPRLPNESTFTLYPSDINALQSFPVPISLQIQTVRFSFEECSDFFNRVILYQLNFWGRK